MALAAKDAGLTVNGTVAEMMALQQAGGLISDKVLPHFAKRMSEAARANGGLDKAMMSNRVAMNRMVFAFSEAADIIFQSGFGEGLTEIFNTLATTVVDLKPLWQSMGKVIGSVFSLISDGIKAITPTVIAMSNVFKSMVDNIGDGREYLLTLIGPAAWLGRIFATLALRINPWVAGLTAGMLVIQEMAFWAEEFDNLLFSKNKIGVLYDPRQGANNDTVGKVSTNFLGAADTSKMGIGDSMAYSMLSMFSQKNPLEFLSSAIGSAGNAGNFINKQFTMTGVVNIDGQKVGEVAANSDAVNDKIQTVIRGVQQ